MQGGEHRSVKSQTAGVTLFCRVRVKTRYKQTCCVLAMYVHGRCDGGPWPNDCGMHHNSAPSSCRAVRPLGLLPTRGPCRMFLDPTITG